MSKSAYVSGFESELRPHLYWALIFVMALGLALVLVSEANPAHPSRFALHTTSLLLFGLSGLAWLLDRWHPPSARWATVVALAAIVHLGSHWLDQDSILVLGCIPVALGAVLISLPAAAAVAVCETLLFMLAPSSVAAGASGPTIVVAMVADWMILVFMIGAYRPIQQLGRWQWDYFQSVQATLEESRDRKVEREQTLENLANANRQLALANERMDTLRLVAEEARKAKAMFVAKVSHEFRTPLNMIIGLVSLMLDKPQIYTVALPPEMQEDLRTVHRNCQHLSNMIGDVLNLTQMETGRLVLRKERVDLAELVDNAIGAVRPLMEKKGLALQTIVPDDLPRVYCDRTRIQQVILNLLSNAARFTERGDISVHVERRGGWVVVSVTDTGPGIAPEDTERIFEPFNQGTSDIWRDKGGTGLGLSISRQFVKHHGGRMWLESKLGVGTTFSFELPISEPLEHAAGPDRWIRSDWVWRERAFQTDRVAQPVRPRVVICDKAGVLYPELARRTDEVEFIGASDVQQVADGLRQCPAHAVILNARSPQDLFSLVQEARREISSTPLIGCSIPPRVERALEAGASSYLTKPVTRAELADAIRGTGRPVKRVLVVDDDPDVVRLLTRMLHACDETLQVDTAFTGREALNALRSQPADLVLLDLVMPDMDGWEVLGRKSQDGDLRDIPVIVLSALDPSEQPLTSGLLLATIDEGLSLNQVLGCSLKLSSLLLNPDGGPGPMPQ